MKRLALLLVLAACPASDKSSPPPIGSGNDGSRQTGIGRDREIQVILDGDLEISAGQLGKEDVRKVVKQNVGKLSYCYEKTLLANPGIEGRVVAQFTVEPAGSVSDVKASGVHPDVELCVADAVKAMKFPPQGTKVEVEYPFTFKPA
jgi:TonB family protein